MKERDRFVEVAERIVIGVTAMWFLWSFMLLAVLLS